MRPSRGSPQAGQAPKPSCEAPGTPPRRLGPDSPGEAPGRRVRVISARLGEPGHLKSRAEQSREEGASGGLSCSSLDTQKRRAGGVDGPAARRVWHVLTHTGS